MNSITLHKMPSPLYGLLKQKARREGRSMNRTIQDLLSEALGLSATQRPGHAKDVYEETCGSMPADECRRMLEAEGDFERIDPEDWL